MTVVVGSVNLFIGIFNTIQQYFKISEYSENYRICALAWGKYARRIQHNLSKSPEDREEDPRIFINKASEDLERLMETTPIFPKEIIEKLAKKLKNNNDEFIGFVKPAILNGVCPSNKFIYCSQNQSQCQIHDIDEIVKSNNV